MDIKINNTLTGEKEIFKPIKKGEVSMYNCGPTVYDYAHVGNLRSYVFADTLRRMFEYNKYDVKQIINITDIGHLSSDNDDGEDKMTKALKRKEKPLTLEAMREIGNFYFAKFKKDLKDLNIKTPMEFPFASDHIQEDIDLINTLTEKGFTYTTFDGIYFDIGKFPEYGKLGNIKVENAGESRITMNPEKKNPRDFAVWKFSDELGYNASFGKGFPGWHIECTAMSVKYLGSEFDIHTGGIDHIPIHHNNEIAQAVCAGYQYAKVWMHNAHLNMGEEKMAKSGENFITLQTLKEKNIDSLTLRYVFLGAQYSSPLQFSWEALDGAQTALKRLRMKISLLPDSGSVQTTDFNLFINDDLNTPKALALTWDILKDENMSERDKKATILDFDKVLGLELDKIETFEVPENVRALVKERDLARANKDFTKSDELRAKITELGYEIKDLEQKTEIYPL